jgi:hypothetical protein
MENTKEIKEGVKKRYLDILKDMDNTIVLGQPIYVQKALNWGMKRKGFKGRKWILIGHADGYDSVSNRATVFALEGSPIRGFVIVSYGWASRYEGMGKRVATYHRFNEELE